MPRFHSLTRSVLAALLVALAAQAARAQDDDTKKAAKEAESLRPGLQKKLAAGGDLQKRLRLDKFEAAPGAVKVVGVFLDSPPAKADDTPPFDQVAEELAKIVRDQLKAPKLKLDTSGITRVPLEQHPHVVLQLAANAKAAKGEPLADQVLFTGSTFGPGGGLSVAGKLAAGAAAEKWLTASALTEAIAKNPAAKRPGAEAAVTLDLKAVEWKADPAAIQKVLATAGKPDGTPEEKEALALRRLLVVRAYFTYQTGQGSAALRFKIDGVRMGEAEVKVERAQDAIRPLVAETTGRPNQDGDYGPLVASAIEEPVAALRGAVVARPALDGVRIDPGFTFGPAGEVLPAGVQPGLDEEGRKELQAVVREGFAALGKGKPLAAQYALVAKRPVSARAMAALPIRQVMAELRAWVIAKKDDLKLERLYFPTDPAALSRKYAVSAGGLVLVYRPSSAADVKDVEAEFRRLLKADLPEGVPPAPGAGAKDDAPPSPKDKEPLLPGMTAYLRGVLAGDQKKWNGVLIERGYFDEKNRYVLLGVLDRSGQELELGKLLAGLESDPKWEEYFRSQPTRLAFAVIPMSEMLERVRRVTPAYPEFDGARIDSARYDAAGNLVFGAHVVGLLDPGAAQKLKELLADHPLYKRRVPAGKQVVIQRGSGTPYSDDQLANFSLAFGAKLLAKAGAGKGDRAKAREWLDMALLHYPQESAVWFLDAYYNFAVARDDELARRDLYRVIDAEGPLAFNGPSQRRRRYEAAKDLQGPTRIKLEDLWLECFREVKDGAKPITLRK
jgi:hypothetical protein